MGLTSRLAAHIVQATAGTNAADDEHHDHKDDAADHRAQHGGGLHEF